MFKSVFTPAVQDDQNKLVLQCKRSLQYFCNSCASAKNLTLLRRKQTEMCSPAHPPGRYSYLSLAVAKKSITCLMWVGRTDCLRPLVGSQGY